ncbi:MAG TPA: NBR1-Ig-like domain-containing protein [Anaerolineales bacterium]
MTAPRKTKLLIWAAALALIMACVPTLAAPSVPTLDPGAVNTFIAQTVIAASTRTAAAMPSLTPTATLTPIQNTDTPEPTATNTVIFILSSPTPLVIPTFTLSSSGGGSSSDNFACRITKVSPANGSSFNPRDDFDAVWTVRNIGQKKWDRTGVDYIYSSGDKLHKISGYDLSSNVSVGESIDLGVDMQAPKNSGTYTTTWTMRSGSKTFCTMTLTIVVK